MLDCSFHSNSLNPSWHALFNEDGYGHLLCFEHVPQSLHYLVGGCTPGLRLGVDFFEWMDDALAVERHVGLTQRSTVAGIKSGVPLLVLAPETDHHKITLLDQGA